MTERKKEIELTQSGLISVVLPCFKMGAYLSEALASISAQTYSCWEVIVVDDAGPEDGTRALTENFAKLHTNQRVVYIRHVLNAGVSAARNTGLDAARGEFVAFLDPDDVLLPQHLQTCKVALDDDTEAVIAATPVEYFWETEQRGGVCLFQKWQTQQFPASLSLNNFIQPSAMLVRSFAARKLCGFDTSPSLNHIEDYDFLLRAIALGMKMRLLPQATCRYRKHPGGASSDARRMAELHNALATRHLPMLYWMNSELLIKTQNEIQLMRPAFDGPIFRLIRKVDRILVYLMRLIGRQFYLNQSK